MLHMDGLARRYGRAVEDWVEYVRTLRPAIGKVEVIGTNALAPVGEREAEIALRARADHQGVAFAFGHVGIFFAARIGFGLGQRRREGEAARLVGGAAREQAAGAAVRDADFGARNGKPGVERGHPGERARTEEHTSELQSQMRIAYAV